MDQPKKAYRNIDFLTGPRARPVRILCEYSEPYERLQVHNIKDTVVFFGSARARDAAEAAKMVDDAQAKLVGSPHDPALKKALDRAQSAVKLSKWYEATRELARRVTEWSEAREDGARRYLVCTGGGPGMMEAANRGAAEVEGGRSIGLGISLPFEQGVNDYVTRGLDFEFHYFFMRKYWFAYYMKAMVVCPGGFGTLDELFEVLTLVQTRKIKKRVPIVLFGESFWRGIMNLDAMAEAGVISEEDLELVHYTDSVDEAFDWLIAEIQRNEVDGMPGPVVSYEP